MLPVYLAEMYALKRTDPIVREAFSDGEFAVQTNKIPFTGIGMGHRGEQINKILKIDGGIVGISRSISLFPPRLFAKQSDLIFVIL